MINESKIISNFSTYQNNFEATCQNKIKIDSEVDEIKNIFFHNSNFWFLKLFLTFGNSFEYINERYKDLFRNPTLQPPWVFRPDIEKSLHKIGILVWTLHLHQFLKNYHMVDNWQKELYQTEQEFISSDQTPKGNFRPKLRHFLWVLSKLWAK